MNDPWNTTLAQLLSTGFPHLKSSVLPVLGSKISISVPTRLDQKALEAASDSHYQVVISKQGFTGEFSGSCFLVMEERASSCFSEMYANHEEEEQEDIDQEDCCKEFMNIATNALISKIDDELGCDHDYTFPEFFRGNSPALIKELLEKHNYGYAYQSTISFVKLVKIRADLIYGFTEQEMQKMKDFCQRVRRKAS